MKVVALLFGLFLLAGCAAMTSEELPIGTTSIPKKEVPADFDYNLGRLEPVEPPYCWVQAPKSDLWYPCGHAPGQVFTPHTGH